VAAVIRAVLFDFGGVILSSPFEAFARYESANGLPDGLLRQINATNPDTNAWARFERSDVGIDEFCDLFEAEAAALGHAVDARAVLELLVGELRPRMVAAVRALHADDRYVTALLTNNVVTMPAGQGNAAHVDREDEMAQVLAGFDAIVESSKVGVRKPEPRFYELACETLDIEPTEAVFLDDLGVNLKPARAMGMHTIKVVDPDVALDELEALLGHPLT
jgi:putative hydrolase of the HAD superfamily